MPVVDAPLTTPAVAQPFEHLVLDFLAYLEFERGLSRNTLEAYRSDLLQYGAYLHGRDALAVTHSDLAGFVTSLAAGDGEKPPVAPATLQRKVACLRPFHPHPPRPGARVVRPAPARRRGPGGRPDGDPAPAQAERAAAAGALARRGGQAARAA